MGKPGGDKTAPELRCLKLKAPESHPWLDRLWGACRVHLTATEMHIYTELFFLEQSVSPSIHVSPGSQQSRGSLRGKGVEGTSGKFLELAKKQITDMDFRISQRQGIFGATVLGSVPPLMQ